MADHRFLYPRVHEIPAKPAQHDPSQRLVRPSQRDLVLASLVRRPAVQEGR
jgi:hypothetical protein